MDLTLGQGRTMMDTAGWGYLMASLANESSVRRATFALYDQSFYTRGGSFGGGGAQSSNRISQHQTYIQVVGVYLMFLGVTCSVSRWRD